MIRHGAAERALAYALAAVAGFVDATGFLETGGFFVSFMTGNSTRLGVGIAIERAAFLAAITLIGCFVAGVVAGALTIRAKRKGENVVILLAVAVLLLASGIIRWIAIPFLPACIAAFAMGMINLTFRRDGEVSIAIGYMTGTLVRMGLRLADGICGVAPVHHCLPFLAMWMALVGGVALGAIAGSGDWTANYFLAAAALAVIAFVVVRVNRDDVARPS